MISHGNDFVCSIEMMKSFFRNVGSGNISATVFEKLIHQRWIHALAQSARRTADAADHNGTDIIPAISLPPDPNPRYSYYLYS